MRLRYALPVYLGLLAAPGAAAEINETLGAVTLLICIGGYAAFVVAHHIRLFWPRTWRTISDAPAFFVSWIAALQPGSRLRVAPIVPPPQVGTALQDSSGRANSDAGISMAE
jgi:hypothetical protein